tara:strand:+ start:242 stop:406 length:165 start_codon:yes stop_codon:yes gene_type:complete
MADIKRVVISSTQKNGKIVAQQVVYQSEGFSRTKHEKVKMIDDNNLEIIQPKGK